MNAVILSIGDELVLGQNVDTNSAWLSARLAEHGVMTLWHHTIADDLEATVAAIRAAAAAADLIVVTGGLGPTADDLTREALAKVLGTELELHGPSLERIRRRFLEKLGRPMPESNQVQALCPRGAEMLDNDWGTAPGVRCRVGRALLFAFPGVPREMIPMFDRYVAPAVAGQTGRTILTEALRTYGAGESTVAEALGELMKRDRNPMVGTTASNGIITVRVRSDFPAAAAARRALDETCAEIERRLGPLVYGRGDASLPGALGELLKARGRTIATVESCTGGLVATMLTDVAGSSAYMLGGWVVYSNELKTREVGVAAELISGHGAVSEPVARAMAEGGLRESWADYALALTGIAGPAGGSAAKPVGTVWIAIARRTGRTTAERFQFPGDRDVVRDRAAKAALNLLRMELLEEGKATAGRPQA
jgi:nicotinamide-nucleotide amidase